MQVIPTTCCSLCHLRADDDTPLSLLRRQIALLKDRADSRGWAGTPSDAGGQRSAFCITSPGEDTLETNLGLLGFRAVTTLPRRKGYPAGKLIMWVLSW